MPPLLACAYHRALELRLRGRFRGACAAFAAIAQGEVETDTDVVADVLSWRRAATQSSEALRASAPPPGLIVPDALFNLGLLELVMEQRSSASGENEDAQPQQSCAVRACGVTAAMPNMNSSAVALRCFALAERTGHPEAPMLAAHVLWLRGLDDLALRANARAVCATGS